MNKRKKKQEEKQRRRIYKAQVIEKGMSFPYLNRTARGVRLKMLVFLTFFVTANLITPSKT